jgi:hypothetical protein
MNNEKTMSSDKCELCIRKFACTNSPPPCVSLCCWTPCEDNCFCAKIGRFGADVDDSSRKRLMYFAAFASVVGIIFSALTIFSFDVHFSMIESFCWTKGTVMQNGTKIEMFVGLQNVAIRINSDEKVFQWDNAKCSELLASDSCEKCRSAVFEIGTPALMALVTAFPQLSTDLVRSLPDQDVRCQKAFGIITGLWGLFSTLAALNAFGYSCRRSLDAISNQTWKVGPGLGLAVAAAALKVIDVVIHAYVAVPNDPPSHYHLKPGGKGLGGDKKGEAQLEEIVRL